MVEVRVMSTLSSTENSKQQSQNMLVEPAKINSTVVNRVQTPPNAPKIREPSDTEEQSKYPSKDGETTARKKGKRKYSLKPLLKGEYVVQDDGTITWSGLWGMNESAFEPNGYLSKFHYSFSHGVEQESHLQMENVKTAPQVSETTVSSPSSNKGRFPRDGYYNGYFVMGAAKPGGQPTKHTEKEILIKFVPNSTTDNKNTMTYTVKGTGKNQFGTFELDGSFDPITKDMYLHRNYIVMSPRVRRASARITNAAAAGSVSVPDMIRSVETSQQQPPGSGNPATSRCGRIRRMPSHLLDEDELKETDLASRMLRVLDAVTSADPNNWFVVPVDAQALGLADYHTVIKQPMDLGTVRSRIVAKKYDTPNAFATDVRLTFGNAMTYNPPRHAVHETAKGLLRLFERKYRELVKEPNKKQDPAESPKSGGETKPKAATNSNPPSRRNSTARTGKKPKTNNNRRKSKSRATEIDDMKTQIELMNQEIDSLRTSALLDDPFGLGQSSGFIPIEKPPKMMRTSIATELTYEEKQALGLDIHKLDADQLSTVLAIIEQAGYSIHNDTGEVEIDFDLMDAGTLRELQEYVQAQSE